MSTFNVPNAGNDDKQWRFTFLMNSISGQESAAAAEANKYLVALASSLLGIVLFKDSHTIVGPVRAIADVLLALATIGAFWLFYLTSRSRTRYTVQDVLDQKFDKLLAAYKTGESFAATRDKVWSSVVLIWVGGYLEAFVGALILQGLEKH